MKEAIIQPTGDEILSGVVEDTDSPMIKEVLERIGFSVTVARPVVDEEALIEARIRGAAGVGYTLVVLIGGSGGGHRHDPGMTRDVTHTALDALLRDTASTGLYGKNGHLWSRLVCGYIQETMVVNVPGPYQEAKAAIEAFASSYHGPDTELKALNDAMARAVCLTYGTGMGRTLARCDDSGSDR